MWLSEKEMPMWASHNCVKDRLSVRLSRCLARPNPTDLSRRGIERLVPSHNGTAAVGIYPTATDRTGSLRHAAGAATLQHSA